MIKGILYKISGCYSFTRSVNNPKNHIIFNLNNTSHLTIHAAQFPYNSCLLNRHYLYICITFVLFWDLLNSEGSLLYISSHVPVFVQIPPKWRRLYHGTCVLPGSAVEFGMVHLKRAPPQYNHLAGLLDVFKAKQVLLKT